MNFLKNNLLYLLSFLLLLNSFYFLSYYFFGSSFKQIEDQENRKKVQGLIATVDSKIEFIKSTASDYSEWDDTYNFVENKNQEYIYNNFRNGINTLEGLDLDFMLFVDLEEKVLFSTYNETCNNLQNIKFEKKVLESFKNTQLSHTLFRYGSRYFYLVKAKILKSDGLGEHNGYIYTGKKFTVDDINKRFKDFSNIELQNLAAKNFSFSVESEHFSKVKVEVTKEQSLIHTNVQLFDLSGNYIVSILMQNNREIVENGMKTIGIYNLLSFVFLFFIFYFLYKNRVMTKQYEKRLENDIETKTKQLNESIQKIEKINEDLYKLAHKDYLTGINNRRSFYIQGKKALENSIKTESSFSLLMMDLDNFKTINDTYGHDMGDKVLLEFCSIVQSCIEEDDIFGRLGGEEFAVILLNKDEKTVDAISESIRAKCEHTLVDFEEKQLNFTVSFGLSQREDFDNIDKIMQKSDQLMYRAKQSGKNKVIRGSSTDSF